MTAIEEEKFRLSGRCKWDRNEDKYMKIHITSYRVHYFIGGHTYWIEMYYKGLRFRSAHFGSRRDGTTIIDHVGPYNYLEWWHYEDIWDGTTDLVYQTGAIVSHHIIDYAWIHASDACSRVKCPFIRGWKEWKKALGRTNK